MAIVAFPLIGKPEICRDCNTRFVDFASHGLCDACLVEYVNGAGELELDDDDLFIAVKPMQRIPPRRKCAVCDMSSVLAGELCEHCRRDLRGLLASLTSQQDTIIKRMEQAQIDLDLHISCASPIEQARYAKMCELRKDGKLQDKDYRTAQALQDGLGAIVRADARVCDQWRDVEALNALECKIASVELAIEGLKESE